MNSWKGIKLFISLKYLVSSVPTVLSLDNGGSIINPYVIANILNNCFASLAETAKYA